MTTSATAAAATAPTGASIYTSAAKTAAPASQAYNSQLFLKLLTTQLSNQDPSSPMDSAQMVEQTSQLASMEQLTDMNKTVTSSLNSQMQSTATNMLGKTVTWTDSTGAAQSGVVASISFKDPTAPTLTVGSNTVALADVTGVTTASTP